MDHAEAIRLQAAVKYVLGELPETLRDEYEEHYFDCGVCVIDVKALATFMDGARETLRQQEREESRGRVAAPSRPGLFAWFRPAFALPAFAALLLFAGYQSFVLISRQNDAAPSTVALASNAYSLLGANSRGGNAVTIPIRRDEGFSLTNIDIPPGTGYDSYVAQLVDASGHVLLQTRISANQAKDSVQLFVPPGKVPHSGVCTLMVTGDPGAKGEVVPQNEVLRLSFTVAFDR